MAYLALLAGLPTPFFENLATSTSTPAPASQDLVTTTPAQQTNPTPTTTPIQSCCKSADYTALLLRNNLFVKTLEFCNFVEFFYFGKCKTQILQMFRGAKIF